MLPLAKIPEMLFASFLLNDNTVSSCDKTFVISVSKLCACIFKMQVKPKTRVKKKVGLFHNCCVLRVKK
jgi:hypothetical protein